MSSPSSSGLGYPSGATRSIARPICSVVVTYRGSARFSNGSTGDSTTYSHRYQPVFDGTPCSGTMTAGRNEARQLRFDR